MTDLCDDCKGGVCTTDHCKKHAEEKLAAEKKEREGLYPVIDEMKRVRAVLEEKLEESKKLRREEYERNERLLMTQARLTKEHDAKLEEYKSICDRAIEAIPKEHWDGSHCLIASVEKVVAKLAEFAEAFRISNNLVGTLKSKLTAAEREITRLMEAEAKLETERASLERRECMLTRPGPTTCKILQEHKAAIAKLEKEKERDEVVKNAVYLMADKENAELKAEVKRLTDKIQEIYDEYEKKLDGHDYYCLKALGGYPPVNPLNPSGDEKGTGVGVNAGSGMSDRVPSTVAIGSEATGDGHSPSLETSEDRTLFCLRQCTEKNGCDVCMRQEGPCQDQVKPESSGDGKGGTDTGTSQVREVPTGTSPAPKSLEGKSIKCLTCDTKLGTLIVPLTPMESYCGDCWKLLNIESSDDGKGREPQIATGEKKVPETRKSDEAERGDAISPQIPPAPETSEDSKKEIDGKCICLQCDMYELCGYSPCGPGGVAPAPRPESKYDYPDKCPFCSFWVVKVRRKDGGGFEIDEGCVSEEERCASCCFSDTRDKEPAKKE